MTLITTTGIAASILTAFSLLPQLIKVIREKKAENVSYGMLAILFAGLALWTFYGILKEDVIISVANGFSFFLNFILVIFSIKYKNKRRCQ